MTMTKGEHVQVNINGKPHDVTVTQVYKGGGFAGIPDFYAGTGAEQWYEADQLANCTTGPESDNAEPFDVAGKLIEYEQGSLDGDGEIELFQHLVDTGLAWTLQGTYGRQAKYLIDNGLVFLPSQKGTA